MAMLSAGYGPPRSGGGLVGGEFPPSPLLYRHAPAPFPGATPAGSLPGVRDLEIKSELPMAHPPGISAADTAGNS